MTDAPSMVRAVGREADRTARSLIEEAVDIQLSDPHSRDAKTLHFVADAFHRFGDLLAELAQQIEEDPT